MKRSRCSTSAARASGCSTRRASMRSLAVAGEHRIVHCEPHAYCSHPHAVGLPGGDWLVVFNRTFRRPFILHPPQDPYFHNLIICSNDRGQTWSAPLMAPHHDWFGVECAGLTALPEGPVLLHQWRFQWLPLPAARKLKNAASLALPGDLARGLELSKELDGLGSADPERLMPWARARARLCPRLGRSWRDLEPDGRARHGAVRGWLQHAGRNSAARWPARAAALRHSGL
jgi:hypothetical protein